MRKSRAKLHDYIDEFQLLSSKNDEMMTKKAENTATVAKTASDSKNAIPKSDLLNKSPKIVKTSMLARLVEYYISARAQFGQSDIWWELPLKVREHPYLTYMNSSEKLKRLLLSSDFVSVLRRKT